MAKTSIKPTHSTKTNSAIELVQWPAPLAEANKKHADKVLAVQTTRLTPDKLLENKSSAYQGFNLGLHVGDCAKQVEHNRQYLHNFLPPNAKIQWLEQVHGNEVAEITQVFKQAIIADAAVTRKKNTCLAIMTADCLPILLASKAGDEIAAIHGGWRPLAANIIANTLDKMKTPAADLYAWLGPCISKNAFEVGDEVKASFMQQGEHFNSAFVAKKNNGKYWADLHRIAALQLASLGINYINTLPECTYANTGKYYSYRKNTITGRMATLICLL
ncbi:MAG: peptidoglycan editing factor PgeF [Colwellia sp.]|nr:peptidoglycan editing factor PgeF [Colwellia sp.]